VLIGTTVTVQPPLYVDGILEIQYTKLEQYTTAEVETSIKNAILTGFGYNGMSFQDTIYPQEIEFVLQQTAGIQTAKVMSMHLIGDTGLDTLIGAAGEIFRFTEDNISLTEA
jgi:hypothetical protein